MDGRDGTLMKDRGSIAAVAKGLKTQLSPALGSRRYGDLWRFHLRI